MFQMPCGVDSKRRVRYFEVVVWRTVAPSRTRIVREDCGTGSAVLLVG